MRPVDFLLITFLIFVLASAGYAIYRARKKGKRCIGCPDSGVCGAGCCGNCGSCQSGCQE